MERLQGDDPQLDAGLEVDIFKVNILEASERGTYVFKALRAEPA
ncbi:MAG: hypothetical protein R2724_16935 [Bryobacterales bacterium]